MGYPNHGAGGRLDGTTAGHPGLIKAMNTTPFHSAKVGKAPRLLAVAGLAALAAIVALPGTSFAAATASAVPPLNGQALGQAIVGLPSGQETAAVVAVGGSSGHWSGASGLASIAAGTPAGTGGEIRIGSISKTFIATVVLQLVAEHRVSLDEPIQRYLPGLLPAGDPPITVAELLNHTSGLGPADGVVNTGDPAWFLTNRLDGFTTEQLLGSVLQEPLIFAPGSHQQYNGVNYIVLAMLVQHVTGHTYAQEIQPLACSPLATCPAHLSSASPRSSPPTPTRCWRPSSPSPRLPMTRQPA